MGSRYQTFMRQAFENLEGETKRAIKSALLRGLSALLGATVQDSSRAAFHWNVVAARGVGASPGRRKFMNYHPEIRGKAPVGQRGDGGANRGRVSKYREATEDKYIEGRLSRRKPDTVFAYYNPILDDPEYAENAHLEQALREAIAIADEHFSRLARRRAAYRQRH